MRMASNLMQKDRKLINEKTRKYSSLIAAINDVNLLGNKLITMQICANNLRKMGGIFGKADPYFSIQRLTKDGKVVTVFENRENHIRKTLNPTWKPFQIESQSLCNNDEFRPFTISVYNFKDNGTDDYIGKIETTLNELKSAPKNVNLMRDTDRDKTKKKKLGTISVLSYSSSKNIHF